MVSLIVEKADASDDGCLISPLDAEYGVLYELVCPQFEDDGLPVVVIREHDNRTCVRLVAVYYKGIDRPALHNWVFNIGRPTNSVKLRRLPPGTVVILSNSVLPACDRQDV